MTTFKISRFFKGRFLAILNFRDFGVSKPSHLIFRDFLYRVTKLNKKRE